MKINRSPTSPLFKSSSVDWTNVGDKIGNRKTKSFSLVFEFLILSLETWFEKAKTPGKKHARILTMY